MDKHFTKALSIVSILNPRKKTILPQGIKLKQMKRKWTLEISLNIEPYDILKDLDAI